MKKILFIIVLLPILLIGQTKNIVPRGDGQGRIGTASKAWLAVHADSIYLLGSSLQDIVQDSVDLRLIKDISTLTEISQAERDQAQDLVIPTNTGGDTYKINAYNLPVQTATQQLLNSKVSQTDFNSFSVYMQSEIDRLEALIGAIDTIPPPPYAENPTNLVADATNSETVGSITLTWQNNEGGGYDRIYRSTSPTGPFTLVDSVAYTVETWTMNNVTPYTNTYWFYVLSSNAGYVSDLTYALNNKVSAFVGSNWFFTANGSGTMTGRSWTNSLPITRLSRGNSWVSSNVIAGDTLFIDGGPAGDSVVYGPTHSASDELGAAAFQIATNGTADKYITVTKQIYNNLHNGKAIFRNFYLPRIIWLFIGSYLEISYLQLEPNNTQYYSTDTGLYGVAIGGGSPADHVRVLHCDIDWTYCSGIAAGNGLVTNTYIAYNNIYTRNVTGADLTHAKWRQSNGIKGDYTGLKNLVVEYNTFINRTDFTYVNVPDTMPHRDFLQLNGLNPDGGTFRFNNNFVCEVYSGTNLNLCQKVNMEDAQGNLLFYNNVFVVVNSDGYAVSCDAPTSPTYPPHLQMYNNVIIFKSGLYAGDLTYIESIGSSNKVTFKNNLVYAYSGAPFQSLNGTLDFANNRYEIPGPYMASGYPLSTWFSTIEPTGNNDGFTLVDDNFSSVSTNPADYMLALGSNGIDDGVNLSAIFTNDFRDTSRVGRTWDVGAFERVSSDAGGGGNEELYGNNLVTNYTLASNATGWGGVTSTVKWYNTDWNNVDTVYAALDSVNAGATNARMYVPLTSNLETGKTYRLQFSYLIANENTVGVTLRAYDYYTSTQYFTDLLTTKGTWVNVDVTFIPVETKDEIGWRLMTSGGLDGAAPGEKFYIGYVILREVL